MKDAPSPGAQETATEPRTSRALVACALGAVYIVWGSTYYAMRLALATFAPFRMASLRFLAAGLLLYGVRRARGAARPTMAQWGSSLLVGVLLLVCGNGFVAMAERTVDSGVASTVVATMPLWATALGLVWGERPTAREVVGLFVGFLGVLVLHRGGSLSFRGVDAFVLLLAPLTWALGSMWSRRLPMPPGLMAPATQMVAGGVVMMAISLMRDEHMTGPATFRSIAALAYLAVFGSIVAFSAYAFLLRTTRPAIATSYAYVNPLVALAIGSALGGEPFTFAKLAACTLTLVGVGIVSAPRVRTKTAPG